jgi:hypothetical protein
MLDDHLSRVAAYHAALADRNLDPATVLADFRGAVEDDERRQFTAAELCEFGHVTPSVISSWRGRGAFRPAGIRRLVGAGRPPYTWSYQTAYAIYVGRVLREAGESRPATLDIMAAIANTQGDSTVWTDEPVDTDAA